MHHTVGQSAIQQRTGRMCRGEHGIADPRIIGPAPPMPGLLAGFMAQRSRRVILLVSGIIILSLADLLVTIAFLRANSMMEANPIAAYLIRVTQSAWVLAAYKALTVLICVALIYKVRKHLAGELAAWCAMAILTVMAVMWGQYSRQFDDPQHLSLVQMMSEDMHLGLP